MALFPATEEPHAAFPQQEGKAHGGGHEARKQKSERYVHAQQKPQPVKQRKPPGNIRPGRKFGRHIVSRCYILQFNISNSSGLLCVGEQAFATDG